MLISLACSHKENVSLMRTGPLLANSGLFEAGYISFANFLCLWDENWYYFLYHFIPDTL